MMFLLVTLGTIGDFMPFLVVAERLRARRHRVVLVSNAGYAELARASGFEFAAIWDRGLQTLNDVLVQDPEAAWQKVRTEMFEPAAAPTLAAIAHYNRQERCTVLASWSAFGAGAAHRQLGVPLATAYLSPGAFAQEIGDPGQALGFFPDWFWDDAPRRAPALCGFAMPADSQLPDLPPELEAFLGGGPPPVLFTPGSFMRRAGDFFSDAVKACQQLGLRGLLLSPYQDQVPALPPTIRHFRYIALQRLAPRVLAIVHHGGIGTAAQGLRAGLPQLIRPLFFDQFDNAARLERLGVGRRATSIADNLQDLLNSQDVRQNCARIRARFDGTDAAADICGRLEAMA
jgi:rhamnosyltransferase subunit B